ncbi:MAG: enoyl-CoA hydratase/isomerase family protein [Deltaproteobacteria bacterium]|jgi:enoyl-CoA hydratase/carnithine racemase|nr:enoyl-CoA hydratase/isomerase family protein [Deltaproteobacteria bacterium]
MSDPRVLLEKDPETHIARLTLNHPERKNAYDPEMRRAIAAAMDDVANDDGMKVLLLRGAGSVFCSGADMRNAYSWYATKGEERRPSQRRKIAVDRESFSFYHDYIGFPKATIAQIEGYALGGGFELALASDISIASRDTKVGMPAARFLGPAIGNLHLFFHRLGPVLAKRMLLTGDILEVSQLATPSVFTEVVAPEEVGERAEKYAAQVARMPADGIVIAKEAFRLVEQSQAYQGEESASVLFHAFATNLRFEKDEFNFVKERSRSSTTEAFKSRDAHFEGDED